MSALVDTSVILASELPAGTELDGGWAVSAVSVGELETGVLIAGNRTLRAGRLRRLSSVLAAAPVIDIDRAVASRYAELRSATGRVPSNDMWIAATALAHDLTLVTSDRRQAALPVVRSALLGDDGPQAW